MVHLSETTARALLITSISYAFFVLRNTIIMCGIIIAVAATEADEAITSSDFLKNMSISPTKLANRGDLGHF